MNTARDIINQVSATGARLVLVQGGVGFDRPIPDNLLRLARDHKAAIRAELEAQTTQEGIKRLKEAAQGVPATLEELQAFFADDLESFGMGEVSQAGIVQAVRWYVFQHLGRRDPIPEPTPKEQGMVKCSECLQDRCSYRQTTPWGSLIMQSSPQWRWCRDYTAQVHDLNEYRKR
jgi:hypothetical protein